jgi:hypothetical protein
LTNEKKIPETMQTENISAVGGLWFDTAIAKLKFAGECCQQVAGCCQRSSVATTLEHEELIKQFKRA